MGAGHRHTDDFRRGDGYGAVYLRIVLGSVLCSLQFKIGGYILMDHENGRYHRYASCGTWAETLVGTAITLNKGRFVGGQGQP